MSSLPSDSVQQNNGRRGALVVGAWLEAHDMVWRPGEQSTDFGIDGEIELKAGGQLTGLLVKAQVKGHEKIKFNASGSKTETISAKTANLWALTRLPLVALVVDLETAAIFCAVPESVLRTGPLTLARLRRALRPRRTPTPSGRF